MKKKNYPSRQQASAVNAGSLTVTAQTARYVRCRAMYEEFIDRLAEELDDDRDFAAFDQPRQAFDDAFLGLISQSVAVQSTKTGYHSI